MSVLREATMGRSNTLHEGERKGEAITRKQSGRTCKGIGKPSSPVFESTTVWLDLVSPALSNL